MCYGGLPVFGYPISPVLTESVEGVWVGQVQWFERDRLEDHTPEGKGVLAGRLGARLLDLRWRPWQTFPPANDVGSNCVFFRETNHSLCDAFLSYWRANGGLERFGYPITEPFQEVLEGRSYTVQYFERRRMELHPQLPGSPVLLGLLGRDVMYLSTYARSTAYPDCVNSVLPSLRPAYDRMVAPDVFGCPTLLPGTNVPAAIQRFERGVMLWFDGRGRFGPGPRILVTDVDTWVQGLDPDVPPGIGTPPGGTHAPWRGFGKLWAANPEVRNALGWAIEARPQERRADYQVFSEGGIMVRMYAPEEVYAFRSPANPTPHYQIIR